MVMVEEKDGWAAVSIYGNIEAFIKMDSCEKSNVSANRQIN